MTLKICWGEEKMEKTFLVVFVFVNLDFLVWSLDCTC